MSGQISEQSIWVRDYWMSPFYTLILNRVQADFGWCPKLYGPSSLLFPASRLPRSSDSSLQISSGTVAGCSFWDWSNRACTQACSGGTLMSVHSGAKVTLVFS